MQPPHSGLAALRKALPALVGDTGAEALASLVKLFTQDDFQPRQHVPSSAVPPPERWEHFEELQRETGEEAAEAALVDERVAQLEQEILAADEDALVNIAIPLPVPWPGPPSETPPLLSCESCRRVVLASCFPQHAALCQTVTEMKQREALEAAAAAAERVAMQSAASSASRSKPAPPPKKKKPKQAAPAAAAPVAAVAAVHYDAWPGNSPAAAHAAAWVPPEPAWPWALPAPKRRRTHRAGARGLRQASGGDVWPAPIFAVTADVLPSNGLVAHAPHEHHHHAPLEQLAVHQSAPGALHRMGEQGGSGHLYMEEAQLNLDDLMHMGAGASLVSGPTLMGGMLVS